MSKSTIKWGELTPRKRDALVAEHVMGFVRIRWNPERFRDGFIPDKNQGWLAPPDWEQGVKDIDPYPFVTTDTVGENVGDAVPHYTTDIAAAWQVVQEICSIRFWGEMSLKFCEGSRTYVTFVTDIGSDKLSDKFKAHKAWSDRGAPEAICKAALLAVGMRIA